MIMTYGNKDVNATKKCIAKPHQAVDEVKEGEQERHVFHTPGPDHQPLQKARWHKVRKITPYLTVNGEV